MKLIVFLLSLLLVIPHFSWTKPSKAKKDKKVYVAKTKKGVKYKKKRKRYRYIRYPFRANTRVSGDRIKLQDMIRDLYE